MTYSTKGFNVYLFLKQTQAKTVKNKYTKQELQIDRNNKIVFNYGKAMTMAIQF